MHGHPGCRLGFLGLPQLHEGGVGFIVQVALGHPHVGERLARFTLAGQPVDLRLLLGCERSAMEHEHLVWIRLPPFQRVTENGNRTGLCDEG